MSIVLAILKWLGILAGGIVGLLLLLTALILFVPVRYRAEGTRDGGIRFGFSLSWLLRLVMIKKRPDSGVIRLYLFGIPVRRLAGDSAEKAASEASGPDGKKSHGEPERTYSTPAGKKKTEKETDWTYQRGGEPSARPEALEGIMASAPLPLPMQAAGRNHYRHRGSFLYRTSHRGDQPFALCLSEGRAHLSGF